MTELDSKTKKREKSQEKNEQTSDEEEDFDWTDYLKKSNSQPAAWTCFAQNATPPLNEFKVGQKLETNDPRNTSSICLATIIEIAGPRLRLRLDGTDNRNDFWLMCDSDLLHPFEYSAKNGRKIQPPLGYGNDLSKWPKFLEKILNLSHTNNVFAAEEAFKQPPIKPVKNEFKLGQKLEAVDPKNPDLICPATIKQVTKDKILISFDGWSSSSQFWMHYASRDLFPCGWCKQTGHILQHPGFLEEKIKRVKSQSTLPKKTNADKLSEPDFKIISEKCERREDNDSEVMFDLDKVKREAVEPECDNAAEPSRAKCDNRTEYVTLYVRSNFDCGKFINSTKFHKSHTKFGPGQPANIYRSIVQSFVDCAVNRMQVFQMIPDGNGLQLIRYKTSNSCLKKKLNVVSGKEQMWLEIAKVCQILEIDESKLFSTQPTKDNLSIKQSPKQPNNTRIENKENVSSQIKEKCDEFPLTPNTKSCSSSTSSFQDNSVKVQSTQPNACHNKRQLSTEQLDLDESNPASKLCRKDVNEWTIDNVVEFIRGLGDYFTSHIEAFKHHEIDGKALLLLSTDILMKYMGFKLGPALKLNNYLDNLRVSQVQTIYPISLHNQSNLKSEKNLL